jgi:hypothetical protein
MVLSDLGRIGQKQWQLISKDFIGIDLNVFQIMLHHLHGILIVGTTLASPVLSFSLLAAR